LLENLLKNMHNLTFKNSLKLQNEEFYFIINFLDNNILLKNMIKFIVLNLILVQCKMSEQ